MVFNSGRARGLCQEVHESLAWNARSLVFMHMSILLGRSFIAFIKSSKGSLVIKYQESQYEDK